MCVINGVFKSVAMSSAVHLFQFPNHNSEVNYKLLNLGLDGGDDDFIMKFEMKMFGACDQLVRLAFKPMKFSAPNPN